MGSVTAISEPRRYTRAERDALPDDGQGHELIDGNLYVSPRPIPHHQGIAFQVCRLLYDACPPDLVALPEIDLTLGDDTVVEPDVVVARRSDLSDQDLPAVPLLVVEVLSLSTRAIDLGLKWRLYERVGCPSYWVVDPQIPSLAVFELRDGQYVEVAHVRGDRTFIAERPFPVEVNPARLAGW